jgi:hypothetical protein
VLTSVAWGETEFRTQLPSFAMARRACVLGIVCEPYRH